MFNLFRLCRKNRSTCSIRQCCLDIVAGVKCGRGFMLLLCYSQLHTTTSWTLTANFTTVDMSQLRNLTFKNFKKYFGNEQRDPGVQAVSPQVNLFHLPGSRLPLLYAKPVVTFPAAEHHCPLAGTHFTVPRR